MALPQPLHIFQKDIRHLWPETLVSILLFVAFAWAVPYGWQANQYSVFITLLAGLLHVLMPVSWLIVISRLIHDESLVGDRQFWTSRPYHWASLLAAKVLYLIVFLYLPFFLMQVYLLKHAGLYPTTALAGLGHNLLLLTVILVVPITALAAVTSSFPRLLLTALGAILYILVAGGLFGYLILRRMPAPHLVGLLETLLILLPLAALLFQYATRKTGISRGILLATPLLIILLLAITPATALIRSAYPVDTSSDSPKLAPIQRPDSAGPVPTTAPRVLRGDVVLSIPFTVSGVDKDSNYNVEGIAATLTAPRAHWSSPYLASLGTAINGGSPFTVLRVFMPQAVFDKVHDQPADLHLSVAVERLKASPASTWKSTLLPFSVPGHGVCLYPTATDENPDAATNGSPTCRFPLQAPELLFLTANVAPNSCAQPAGPPVPARQVISNPVSSLDFDPVIQVPLQLATGDPNPQHRYQLCAGTELSFLEAKPIAKTRFELDSKQIVLNPYVMRAAPPQAPLRQPQAQPGMPQEPGASVDPANAPE